MKKVIILSEKIKNNGSLEKEDLTYLEEHQSIKKSEKANSLIYQLKNLRSVTISGVQSKIAILEKFLKKNGITVSDDGLLKILLSSTDSNIECDGTDIIIVDGLEEFIDASSKLESLQKYISKTLENTQCKDSIALSLELLSVVEDGDIDAWEDKLDALGSQNPERDIKEYSNIREFRNRLFLELKKKERNNYQQLNELLDSIITQNSSAEDIKKIREKYRSENNYKKIYQEKRESLIKIAKEFSMHLKDKFIVETMQEVANKLEKQEFSIGVTGIIKAGKSTMMNALLGQDILGMAIRPETANLTIIKKDTVSKAIVHFWSKEEWQSIKNSASDEQSQEFVRESENLSNFNSYIDTKSKSIDIKIEALDNYTSARNSDGLCNLVKDVELHLPVEFLDGGVSVVDTPGIDDPIIQREIITKEYLSSCSAILHLMNAKQSATQKDIEFIGDALIDQGISSLLVVITRIDTLGSTKEEIDHELAGIISHTKRELEKYLNRRANSDISDILSRLEFLPLAGKFALQHRIGEHEKALKKGYALEDTGILEIENYLNAMLFGEKNERAKLALSNAYRTIEGNATTYANQLEEKYSIIGLEKSDIENKLHILQEEKEKILEQLDEIKENISTEERKISRELNALKSIFELKFDNLRRNLVDTISNNISDKLFQGDKPDENEIREYIDSNMKEFITDLTQEYQKKSQYIVEESIDFVDTKYTKLELPKDVNITMKVDKIEDMGDFTYQALMIGFGGAVGYTFAFLLGPIGMIGGLLVSWFAGDAIDRKRRESIEKQVAQKMQDVDRQLEKMNREIHHNILTELQKYDDKLMQYFHEVVIKPAQELEAEMHRKEQSLLELKTNAELQGKNDAKLKEEILSQRQLLENKLEQLKNY